MGDHPAYTTLVGALRYVFDMTYFGQVGVENFTKSVDGNDSQESVLWLIFVLATFTLCFHLLNMLIAIMGDVQGA